MSCAEAQAATDGGIAQLGERLNGIQEVSGSIPLISTRQKPRTLVLGFFFVETGSSYIADLLHFNHGKVSGSIPLISTKTKRQVLNLSFCFGKGEELVQR